MKTKFVFRRLHGNLHTIQLMDNNLNWIILYICVFSTHMQVQIIVHLMSLNVFDLKWVSEWVKVAQSCPTLCDPIDYRVHGILQARILEWVAFPFSRGYFQPRDQTQVSHIAGGFSTSWAMREAVCDYF